MKIALLSDVHGETAALAAVLNAAASEGCERVWCLGDSVEWLLPREPARRGDPTALRLLAERAEHLLAGNHEAEMLADAAGRKRLEAEADGDRLVSLLKRLEPRKTVSLGAARVELVHASLTEPSWGMIEVADDVRETFTKTDAGLVLCGHTHLPLAAALRGAEVEFLTPVLGPAELSLPGQAIVNPGSVGRSRDGQAWWAVLRLDEAGEPTAVSWRRTPWQMPRLFR